MVSFPEILVLGAALLPISEVRGAIPLAILVFRLGNLKTLSLAILGNILVIPLVYGGFSLLNFIFPKFLFEIEKIIKKRYQKVNFFNFFALAMFVAIPLPFTGAWSGTTIAFLFKVPFLITFLSEALGILLSSLIVFTLTKSGILLTNYYGIQGLLGFMLILILIFSFWKFSK